MANTKKTPDYRKLSVPERLQLVEDIWDSIAQDAGTIPVPSDVLEEAERRLEEHRADPQSAIPWHEVKAELYKRGG
jgi:putative addiction module component (TIGR02574 family)